MRVFLIKTVLTSLASLASAQAVKAEGVLTDAGQALRKAYFEVTNANSITLSFKEGSTRLDKSEQNRLKALIDAYSNDKKIGEVILASYSDKDYPKGNEKALRTRDRNIAASRARTVEKILRSWNVGPVKSYNMAEKANWFEKQFVTEDAQIKTEARTEGSTSQEDAYYESLGQHLRKQGGAHTVVLVLRHE